MKELEVSRLFMDPTERVISHPLASIDKAKNAVDYDPKYSDQRGRD
jgi:hypothetical protein